MISTVFLDIDGTIASLVDGHVTPGVPQAIAQLQAFGIQVFACTGRDPGMLAEFQQENGIKFDGYIAFGGALGVVGSNEVWRTPLDGADVNALLDAAESRNYTVVLCEDRQWYSNIEDPRLTAQGINLRMPRLSLLRGRSFMQALAGVAVGEEWKVNDLLTTSRCNRWNSEFIDIFNGGVSKRNGVEKMMKYCFCSPQDCIAFGDGEVDVAMFDAVGTAVATVNGSPRAKEKADFVADDVEGLGILPALKHYFPFLQLGI